MEALNLYNAVVGCRCEEAINPYCLTFRINGGCFTINGTLIYFTF